ncbi:hypothetical protein ESB00_05120 [Oleiharenicola lentus]|uniref:Glycosyltransferase RgtA/B/C/D-like domain-containing protein n=1 Tax=Oleiharenicola lentus TaxID=2508720 RepID=A0A4Q1C8Z8_9BACT|nr:hypothetical protein [Oleiharenicola lentus]RXK55281.1 hypothetical protein ESB00_05120 [Oleiharenicola lentus]
MPSLFASPRPRLLSFLTVALAALVFALFTQHAWEDYYITYRSSKNLATGHGLVFNHGDRLHTFTSPLGVLLPAVASLLTGNSSDAAALWIFRFMCIAALGGAAAVLVGLARRLAWPGVAAALLALLLATDAKMLDFTINGMETAFMLLFLGLALRAHFTPGPRQWLHLGGAWAGLMWTRPDSFIYIGLVAAGCWIFNDPARTGGDRRAQLLVFLKAGLLTTALYAPWLLWAWWYYGSPVPHTIVAKGAQSGGLLAWTRFRENFWQLPWKIWSGDTAALGVFLPSYHMFPAWPAWLWPFGRVLATLASVIWLLPKVRPEARVASLAFFFAAAYLSFVPYFPFPWYLPPVGLLAFVALASVLGQLWTAGGAVGRWVTGAVGVLLLAVGLFMTVGTARQMRAQQTLIEDGTRREIGEWLRANAKPSDTVFMEPLGYIGFFSGLKTYDWPGLSSREVTDACRLVGTPWAHLILYLQPDWLVLRATSDGQLERISGELVASAYERVREFNRSADVAQLDVPGRSLLEFDAHFIVYRRKQVLRQDRDGYRIAALMPSNPQNALGRPMRLVHAPGILVAPLPPGVRTLDVAYGIPDGAREQPYATNGATFEVWLTDGRERTRLLSRSLDPVAQAADRGLQQLSVTLPDRRHPTDAWLSFLTHSNGNTAKDWTFWSDPELR